jgi:riboflavin biosynthesis pyrimidine reductase
MITSADGAAVLNGRSGGLGAEADRQVFALLRALADVILVGAGTARAEGYGPARTGRTWARLREGRPPSAPIAVITRSVDLGAASGLLTGAPQHARTIVITTEAGQADRRAAAADTADLIVAGRDRVDLRAAVGALAAMGHRRILTEGGPHLLGQIAEAGLLDELCVTVSPLLAGSAAGRIVQGAGALADAAGRGLGALSLAHVLEDQGYLLCRYLRSDQA